MAATKKKTTKKKTTTKKKVTSRTSAVGRKKAPAKKKKSSASKKKGARKYSRGASDKVERAVREQKQGKLRSGSSGKKVTGRKQAIAIGLSEARKRGAKVPPKRK